MANWGWSITVLIGINSFDIFGTASFLLEICQRGLERDRYSCRVSSVNFVEEAFWNSVWNSSCIRYVPGAVFVSTGLERLAAIRLPGRTEGGSAAGRINFFLTRRRRKLTTQNGISGYIEAMYLHYIKHRRSVPGLRICHSGFSVKFFQMKKKNGIR